MQEFGGEKLPSDQQDLIPTLDTSVTSLLLCFRTFGMPCDRECQLYLQFLSGRGGGGQKEIARKREGENCLLTLDLLGNECSVHNAESPSSCERISWQMEASASLTAVWVLLANIRHQEKTTYRGSINPRMDLQMFTLNTVRCGVGSG